MALFQDALLEAADTTQVQAGGISFFDKLGGSVAGATISGFGSIYNTGVAVANALGADVPTLNTYNALQELDANWANYYKENANAIDAAGFIGTSLVPGMLAIKGLKAVQAGASSNVFGRALGFAATKQQTALRAALAEAAQEGGTVFTQINRNKFAAMAWGVADQTLQAATFETAVALTMKQSPMLADDSWWDVFKSGLTGAAFGGIIGGGIDSLLLNKSFKNLLKEVDSKQRTFDYQAVYDKFNLAAGDKAWGIVDSMLKLPDQVGDMSGFVKLPELLAERTGAKYYDFSNLFERSLQGSKKSHMQDFEKALMELSPSRDVAEPFARSILQDFATLKSGGADNAAIRERMGDYLFQLKSLSPATKEPLYSFDDLWYFRDKLTKEEMSKIRNIDDWQKLVVSNVPFEGNAYKNPYVFVGSAEDRAKAMSNMVRVGTEAYPTLKSAWDEGKIVAMMPDGTIRVNDSSRHWRRIQDPVYSSSRYLNTKTGALRENAVLTAADRLAAGNILKADARGVQLDSKFINMDTFKADGDVEYFTARHAWASGLDDAKLPDLIDGNDWSLLDRLSSVKDEKALERISIQGDEAVLGDILASEIGDIKNFVDRLKVDAIRQDFDAAFTKGVDLNLEEVAYKYNVDVGKLEELIGKSFNVADNSELQGFTRDLKEYMSRENLIAKYDQPQQFTELKTLHPKMSWRDKRLVIMDQVAMTGGQFVTGELAWQYRVMEAVTATKNAATSVLGSGRTDKLIELSQDAAKLADSLGSGANFLSSSNANYGELLRLWAQDTGKNVHLWIQEDTNAVMDALNTHIQNIRNSPKAAAELGIVTNLLRGSEDKYMWHPTEPNTLVLRDAVKKNTKAGVLNSTKFSEALEAAKEAGKRATITINEPETVNFLKTHQALNADRISKRTTLYNARGTTVNLDPDTLYVPPIDTTYFQHFAFVRPLEGRAFATSEVSMIFGRNADELRARAAMVGKDFEVITKADTEKFYKAKHLYDFDLTINEPRINSELKRTGALTNAFPEVRPENLAEDYIRWHQQQVARLVRDSVETHYAQQVAELRKLGETFVGFATSKFAGLLKSSKSQVFNPYDDFVKTALDISKRSEYVFFHQANEFVDALGTRAYEAVSQTFSDAQKGMVTWQEANTIAERYGIKGLYNSQEDFFTANVPRDRNIVREYVAKANGLLANFVLRFDFANSLLNVVSTPLLLGTEMASIKNLAVKDPALAGKLAELTSIAGPQGIAVPSTSRLVFNAVRNFFGTDKEVLLTRYRANGDIKEVLSQYHSMMDDLALRPDFKVFSDKVDKAFDKIANLTGNNWAEQFTRFVSADVMRQVTEPLVAAGKLSVREQNAYISTFVNRVQGNYISSQRPIVFQGVLGSAIGLFQTYSFNLLQQLLRHVENGDKKALATMFGLQAGLFGLNGTPMFEAVNTHLIGNAAINDGHYDAYSLAPSLLGKGLGDWLMYGTASAMPGFSGQWPAFYSRGDINPRHITILPISPADVPAIDASIRVVSNLVDVGKKLIGGADISSTLLQGLEHNGINRPLAGMAQIMQGQSTTSKGGLISASNDFNLITTASRILGAKPMDEAVALNNLYRMKAYQVADQDRMEFLGEKVKSHLYNNTMPPDDVIDGFMKDYAAAGGRVENFNRSMQRWMKDANSSVVEKMRAKLNTSYGQRLSEIMGGEPLPDYRNATQAGQDLVTPE